MTQEEAERVGAAFLEMEYSMVATLSADGVAVSFHGDGRVTGSHKLKAEEAAHAILDLGREVYGSAWQPIETAPKDGTDFLAYGPGGVGDRKIMAVMHASESGEFWRLSHVSGWEYDVDIEEPTHWMPLTGPPKGA